VRHSSVLTAGVLASLSACADVPDAAEKEASTTSHMFFANSERRDATTAEAARVVHVGLCTSFFLENHANKTYLATARHCSNFAVTEWCASDGVVIDNSGAQGKCTRIVAADVNSDVAVFEADIPHASSGDTTLRLSSFIPKVGTRLIMTGYPLDQDPTNPRNGKLTTTANCWMLTGTVVSPVLGQDQDAPNDILAQHNCSTYGGNSGGPMYVEGARDVIGLPAIFADDFTRRSPTDLSTASYVELTRDFVGIHRAELEAAGVVIADEAVPSTTPSSDAAGDTPSNEPGPDPQKTSPPAPSPSTSSSKNESRSSPPSSSGCRMAPGKRAWASSWSFAFAAAMLLSARRRLHPR
jgi:hypothetical protein